VIRKDEAQQWKLVAGEMLDIVKGIQKVGQYGKSMCLLSVTAWKPSSFYLTYCYICSFVHFHHIIQNALRDWAIIIGRETLRSIGGQKLN